MAAFFMINAKAFSESVARLKNSGKIDSLNTETRAIDLSNCGFHGAAIKVFERCGTLSKNAVSMYVVSLSRYLDYDRLSLIAAEYKINLDNILEEVSHSKLAFEMASLNYLNFFIERARTSSSLPLKAGQRDLCREELIKEFRDSRSLGGALEIAKIAVKQGNLRESAFFINFLVQNGAINKSVVGLFLAFLESFEKSHSFIYLIDKLSDVEHLQNHEFLAVKLQAYIHRRDMESARKLIREVENSKVPTEVLHQLYALLRDKQKLSSLINTRLKNNPKEVNAIIAALKNNIKLPKKSINMLPILENSESTSSGCLATIANFYHQEGRYAKAFALYKKANTKEKELYPFSIEDEQNKMVSITLSVSLQPTLSEYIEYTPIFIVGLPRSGTSIVEKLCADSLKNYLCIGESSAISIYINQFGIPYSKGELLNFARFYIEHNGLLDQNLFIDKMPLNFLYIGLIKRIFPNARIIYCKKNRKRNAWSLYQKIFLGKGNAFCNSTDSIERFIDLERKTMSYWYRKFTDIHHVINENLITNESVVLSELGDFLGTNVEFQDNSDHVTLTASRNQLDHLQKSLDWSYKNYAQYWDYLKD